MILNNLSVLLLSKRNIIALILGLILSNSNAQFNTLGVSNKPVGSNFHNDKKQDSLVRDSVVHLVSKKKLEYNLGMLPLEEIYVTSFYGRRLHPIKKVYTHHNGVDLRARDKNVFAVQTGIITDVAYGDALGQYIVLRCGTFEFIYGHLAHIYVRKGSKVEIGDVIGRTGKTGDVTAKHLHFGIKNNGSAIDPYPILSSIYENLDFTAFSTGNQLNVN